MLTHQTDNIKIEVEEYPDSKEVIITTEFTLVRIILKHVQFGKLRPKEIGNTKLYDGYKILSGDNGDDITIVITAKEEANSTTRQFKLLRFISDGPIEYQVIEKYL